MNQVITFSAELTADAANRTISGKIVPLNVEAGSTNMGKVKINDRLYQLYIKIINFA